MAITQVELESRLKSAFEGAEITITDLAGDGDHYKARIIWSGFTGKSRVQKHQLVNRALADLLAGPLHALALETSGPPLEGG
jgi:stress-induced morphogen